MQQLKQCKGSQIAWSTLKWSSAEGAEEEEGLRTVFSLDLPRGEMFLQGPQLIYTMPSSFWLQASHALVHDAGVEHQNALRLCSLNPKPLQLPLPLPLRGFPNKTTTTFAKVLRSRLHDHGCLFRQTSQCFLLLCSTSQVLSFFLSFFGALLGQFQQI